MKERQEAEIPSAVGKQIMVERQSCFTDMLNLAEVEIRIVGEFGYGKGQQ